MLSSAVVTVAQDDATTGWSSLGSAVTKPGSWRRSWKDSLESRPMNAPILKVLLICGCRFGDQQIAACGAAKVGCREWFKSVGGPSSDTASVPYM